MHRVGNAVVGLKRGFFQLVWMMMMMMIYRIEMSFVVVSAHGAIAGHGGSIELFLVLACALRLV